MIRGSGFARDVRADHPFEGYAHIPVNVFSFDGCDIFSRALVRVKEVFDSIAQCRYVLDNMLWSVSTRAWRTVLATSPGWPEASSKMTKLDKPS